MKAEVGQILALANYGNAALQRRSSFTEIEATQLFGSLADVALQEKEGGEFLSPSDWFVRQQAAGCKAFVVDWGDTSKSRLSARMSNGFVGGGVVWRLGLVFDTQRTGLLHSLFGGERIGFFRPKWNFQGRSEEDNVLPVWQVRYLFDGRSGASMQSAQTDLSALASELKCSLEQVHDFARRESLDNWAGIFSNAIEMLRGENSAEQTNTYHPAEFFSPDALRIHKAAETASVFGGMGSWNDLGFEGKVQSEYDLVSNRLYLAVNNALRGVTNHFANL